MNRRQLLISTVAAAAGLALRHSPFALAVDVKPRRVLFFCKSSNFEHAVIKERDGQPSFVSQVIHRIMPPDVGP